MLVERDARIRELSGDVARLHGENEELQRRATAAPVAAPKEAASNKESPNLINELQNDVGPDASVRYNSKGKISIGVQDAVTFDSGSTTLKESSHKVLRSVAQVLKNKFSGKRFYVEGHTDSDPIVKTKDKFVDNMHLSTERARSVVKYLISQGVPESAIVVVGYGQFDPIDKKSKAANRRVEIVVGESM